MSYVIGVDVGTSGCKAGIVNEVGEVLGIGTHDQLWRTHHRDF